MSRILDSMKKRRDKLKEKEMAILQAQEKKLAPIQDEIDSLERAIATLEPKDLPPQAADDTAAANSPEPSKAEVPAFLSKK